MGLGTLILEIMGNILMIIGSLDMTCVMKERIVFKMAADNIVCTGYNVKLSFFLFKLIELPPKLIKYGIKVSLKVS